MVFFDDTCPLCGHPDHPGAACAGDPHTSARCSCGRPTTDEDDEGLLRDDD